MPTEEEEEEKIRGTPTFREFMDRWFPQLRIYAWMYEAMQKFGNAPVPSSRSVMEKVEEFNRAVEEEDKWTEDKIVCEISLEELEKELEEEEDPTVIEMSGRLVDDGKEVELEVINSPSDWHFGGDSPEEIGRMVHEAMEREGIDPHAFPNRAPVSGVLWRHRSPVGAVFLAHQREQERPLCESCERDGCSDNLKESVANGGFCAGYVDKYKEEPVYLDCPCCGRELDEPDNFPEGFPEKWMVCCFCLDVWKYGIGIYNPQDTFIGMEKDELEQLWKDRKEKLEEIFGLCQNK